jgi:hypothetical protein
MGRTALVVSSLVLAALGSGCMVGDSEDGGLVVDPNTGALVAPPEAGLIEARGGKGGRTPTCVSNPIASVSPDPVLAGEHPITISGTGFCVGAVFVNIKEMFTCYPGGYVSNGTFSVGFPYQGFGSTPTPVTWVSGTTYTAQVWEALSTETGWQVGSLLGTQTFTVQ